LSKIFCKLAATAKAKKIVINNDDIGYFSLFQN